MSDRATGHAVKFLGDPGQVYHRDFMFFRKPFRFINFSGSQRVNE
jgi:hypothetical protein